jgi:hypothetical protein
LTFVDSVRVVWGHFGQDPNGISSWRLLGLRQGAITWEVITSGGFPNASETSIPVKNSYRKSRIAAEGQTNASGIYEVQVLGLQ